MDEIYNRIRGNQVVEARFGNNLDKGLSIVRSDPNVRDVQIDGEKISIEFAEADVNPSDLLKALVSNDVEVINFGRKDPNLEDVFMMVTKGLVS